MFSTRHKQVNTTSRYNSRQSK